MHERSRIAVARLISGRIHKMDVVEFYVAHGHIQVGEVPCSGRGASLAGYKHLKAVNQPQAQFVRRSAGNSSLAKVKP